MRRNNKAEVEFNNKKYKLMDFRDTRFCNAKFVFKDFADSSSLAYCNGWMCAAARPTRHPSMRGALQKAGHVIRFPRCPRKITDTGSGARSERVPVGRERTLLYNWRL
jgi:hypothetical protein